MNGVTRAGAGGSTGAGAGEEDAMSPIGGTGAGAALVWGVPVVVAQAVTNASGMTKPRRIERSMAIPKRASGVPPSAPDNSRFRGRSWMQEVRRRAGGARSPSHVHAELRRVDH